MAWVLPLTMLADFGVSTLITRDVAAAPHLTRAYVKQALRVRLFFGGGLVALTLLLAPFLTSSDAIIGGLRIAACMILIDSTFGVFTAIWRAWETMLPIFLLNALYLTLQVIGALIALSLDAGLNGILLAIVIADGIQLVAAWFVWQLRTLPKAESARDVPFSVVDFMRKAGPFALAAVLATVQLRMMFQLLEALSSTAVVGWFAAASRFIEAARMPPFALFGAIFPAMASLARDPQQLRVTFRRTTLGLAAYATLAALGFALLGGTVIRLSFGDEFAEAAPLLTLLGIALIPSLLRQNFITLRYALGGEQAVNRILLAIVPLQLGIGWMLVRAYDGRGAAYTLIVAETIMLLMLWRVPPRLRWYVPLLLVMTGLAARLLLLDHTAFDGLYGQDAFAYFGYGRDVRAAVSEFRLPEPTHWPLGFPVLLAGAFSFLGTSPEVAQAVSMLMGALCGGVTFLLVYDLLRLVEWPARDAIVAGVVAGLLVSFCGQLLQSSVVVMADAAALFWITFSAWSLVRYAARFNANWLMLAAFSLAMAGVTRWLNLLLILPWGVFCLHVWGWRLRWRHLLLATLAGGVILVPQLIHTWQNPDALVGHSWLQGWSPANAFRRDFVNVDGTFHYAKTVSAFYASAAWDGYYVNPAFLPLMVVGAVMMLRRIPAAILLLGWLLAAYGFLAGIPYQNIRFSLAFFPPLAALAGIGLAYLWRLLEKHPAIGWAAQGAMLLALVVAVITTYDAAEREVARFAAVKNADVAAVHWAGTMIPEDEADVYTLSLWLMMQQYEPRLNALQIFYETPDSLAETFEESPTHPRYVLLNLWAIENQWTGKDPWIAYHWLDENPGLTHLGRHGNYHLLRVN
jgi:O-antigen/teichoic acid export membrane protein